MFEDPPIWGSERYKQQVDEVYSQFTMSGLEHGHLTAFTFTFITDPSYNRMAICDAERRIRKERGWDD